VRDAVMMQALMVLWATNRKVYGAHKLWNAARRAGHDIGRDQVARLMRELGIRGVSRRRKVFTTRPDPDALRAPDLVNRDFTAERPDALWVTDLTYVPTRSGMAYVCFIVDAFSRRIVGWRVAANMRTEMVLGALEMARVARGGRRLIGLVAHSDAGSQFTSVRFTERLDELGARPSIGTVADSYDNALAETTNGLYKAECVYGPDANGWDDIDDLELATLSWVHWFNHDRLHGHCNDVPPAEFEAAFYAAQQADPAGVGTQ
jgi:putative transposase